MRSEDIIIYDERKQIVLKTQEKKVNLLVTIAYFTKASSWITSTFHRKYFTYFQTHMNALKNEMRINMEKSMVY